MATKTKKAASKAVKALEAIGAQVKTLAVPLFNVVTTKGKAGANQATWNARVLDVVVWALETGHSLADVHIHMGQFLASMVRDVGREAELGVEELKNLRKLSENSISQLFKPLWAIARVAEDHLESVLAVATEEGATFASLGRFARQRTDSLMFDASRGSITCHHKVDGVVRSFAVAQASESRNLHTEAVAMADAIKVDNSAMWSAVYRQYREEFPCGFQDRRTRADAMKQSASIGEAIEAKYSQEEIAKLIS